MTSLRHYLLRRRIARLERELDTLLHEAQTWPNRMAAVDDALYLARREHEGALHA